jgi:hypothetical protein
MQFKKKLDKGGTDFVFLNWTVNRSFFTRCPECKYSGKLSEVFTEDSAS